jgi:deoxyribose-phosphate aldolase
MSLTVTAAAAQSMGSALATAIGASSTIKIYSGSKPATPETAATGTLLVTIAVSGSFTSSGGVLTAADPAAASPAASGTAGYFRLATSGGTAIIDGTVTATGGGGDLTLGSTAINTGVNVDLGVPSITVPVA